MGFRVSGLGLGFRVWGLGSRAWGLGLRAWGLVYGAWFRVKGLRLGDSSRLGFGASGLGLRVVMGL